VYMNVTLVADLLYTLDLYIDLFSAILCRAGKNLHTHDTSEQPSHKSRHMFIIATICLSNTSANWVLPSKVRRIVECQDLGARAL
jgi:hypothetical protein